MPSNDSDTNMDNPESAMATSPAVPATPNSKAAPAVVYSVKQYVLLGIICPPLHKLPAVEKCVVIKGTHWVQLCGVH